MVSVSMIRRFETMRLKYLFYLLALMIVVLLAIVCVLSFEAHNVLFYLVEVFIVLVLMYLTYFYGKVLKPLDTISSGMELLSVQDFSTRLAPVGQYESDRIVDLFNRMMDRLKDEKLRISEQHRFLNLLIDASPMGVVIEDFDGHITLANEAALRFLGAASFEQLAGKTLAEVTSPLAREIERIGRNHARTVRLSNSLIYRCSSLAFLDRGFAHPFILIESLTDEVMKAEKKAYEKVIRLISHEVNNTVAGVTSILESVGDELQTRDGTQDLVEGMHVCSNRCMSMSRFITAFADVVKIPDPILRRADLNECVEACKHFMETVCANRHIGLDMHLSPPQTLQVELDRSLFEQVVVNILKNAVESIEEAGRRDGRIRMTTSADPPVLEIADNGKGIAPETESKLFSPFFSTKPNGQGIGLLFVREVLIKHRCTFSLKTYPDGITRFKISFPHPPAKQVVR